ncbi:uncharacterized protein LOC129591733 [Paramacrobiotus metropolitanus]|uniref:uncharacterized protein LOC129591733 n=1 Tax=Paramacrobiotus metropolitanus TaxID=2943436 RepID=UPI00244610E0|nr:uncharacterized protein LOC129591733 [Paramacrobiotus metropolitanus]
MDNAQLVTFLGLVACLLMPSAVSGQVACPAIGCGRNPPCVPAGQPNPPMTPGCPPVCPTCTGNEGGGGSGGINCALVKINCPQYSPCPIRVPTYGGVSSSVSGSSGAVSGSASSSSQTISNPIVIACCPPPPRCLY